MEMNTVQSKPNGVNFELQRASNYQAESNFKNVRITSPGSDTVGGIYSAVTEASIAQSSSKRLKDTQSLPRKCQQVKGVGNPIKVDRLQSYE